VRAVGFWAAGSAVSFAAGPVVGGVLIEQAGWRSIFIINLPVAAVAAALVVRQVGRRTRPVGGPVTIVPQLAAVAMLVSLTFGLIESGDRGWTSPIVLAALGAAAVLAAALGRRERTAATPLIPRELRADRRFTASTLGGVIINFAFYGELFFLSLYLQQERGLDALETGLVFLPQPLLFMAVAPLAGRIVATRGPRPLLGVGAALGVAGALILLAVDENSSYAVMLLGLAVNGLGGGLAVPAITAGAMGSAPQALAGIASATVNAGRQVGGVLGVAVLGGLATAGGGVEVDGIHRALWLAAAGLALGCLLAYAMPARAATAPAREPALAHD
jgi:DHA2 family methylenomycin A resistance protein-like MFS transporter